MNSFLETLKQLGPTRLGIMGAIVLGLLMFFVFVSLRVSTPDMKLLYKDLSSVDSGAIAAKLEESEIIYEVSLNGEQINVPADQVGKARILLAEAGLPNGGSMGYEIFDKQSGFGTTNFVQNINQVRALEGELARTISSMKGVRTARVHLVLPQRELFARESRPSSASVFLGLQPGSALERQQILAIQSLVSSAVPDLKASNVSLIDNNGNLLARGGEEETNLMGIKAEEMRRSMETQLTQKVEDQLGRIVGFGKVRATVTAEINFDRISTNEELFDPASQVIRSSQLTEESGTERDPPDENVSVENNLPGIAGDILDEQPPTAENNRLEEVTNYEISRTVRSTVREVGEIQKLSVAVLVDGRYTTNDKGEKVYEPRAQEEIDQITALVKSSVGYDETRGDLIEVVNMQFASVMPEEELAIDETLFGFDRSDLLEAAEILTVAIMIILVVLLVLQPMVGRLMAPETKDMDDDLEAELLGARPASPALAGPAGDGNFNFESDAEEELISISGVDGKVKASAIKKVEEIVDNYPAETVSVLRTWMTQEN